MGFGYGAGAADSLFDMIRQNQAEAFRQQQLAAQMEQFRGAQETQLRGQDLTHQRFLTGLERDDAAAAAERERADKEKAERESSLASLFEPEPMLGQDIGLPQVPGQAPVAAPQQPARLRALLATPEGRAELLAKFKLDPDKIAPPPKPERAPTVGSFEDFVLRKYGESPTAAQITSARREFEQAGRAPEKPEKPEKAPAPQLVYGPDGSLRAVQFVNGQFVEVPMPPNMRRAAPPKTPEQIEAEAAARTRGAEAGKGPTGIAKLFNTFDRVFGGGEAITGGAVSMRAPDGRLLSVPAEKVAEMERLGATRVGG
jgi:hypothetical protein